MKTQSAILLSALLVALFGQGCIGPPKASRIVCGSCEEPDRFVRLQRAFPQGSEDRAKRFAHPFRLSPEDWKPILASIRIEAGAKPLPFFSNKRMEAPAFTPEEIDYLSGTLSKAFTQAQPEEWVVFGLSQPGKARVTEMTTGGWFLEGEQLHLVLANYRCAVTMPSIRELLMNDPLNPNTGVTFTLIPGPHQTVLQQSAADRSPLLPSPSELSIAYKPLLLKEPVARSAGETSPGQFAPAHPGGTKMPPSPLAPAHPGRAETRPDPTPQDQPPPRLSLEERLQALKRLQEQGLITDEEFRTKKKTLLDQF